MIQRRLSADLVIVAPHPRQAARWIGDIAVPRPGQMTPDAAIGGAR
jgi:hypothetical protein